MRRGGAASIAALAVVVAGLAGAVDQAPAATAAVRPCSNGLVALTFDDGPVSDITPKLLDVLTDSHVPATFFMVGQRVAALKSIALSAYQRGFVIANHTYAHEQLTALSDDGIRSTLRRTADAFKSAGITPSNLMRPPYGATDTRVTNVVTGMGLKPVLWDVDTRNWESGTSDDITTRVLSALRPHGRNIVLLHDGVARSATTLAAVPKIIHGARERGYCFAELGASGEPVPPVPALRVSDAHVKEADPGTGVRLLFTLGLDTPTSVPVSVRIRTEGGSALSDTDFRPVDARVELPSGTTTRQVTVWVRGDRVDEGQERLRLLLSDPQGLKIEDHRGVGTIFDNDPWPRVSLSDATVTEPAEGSTLVPVRLALDRPKSHKVVLVLATRTGEADETDYLPLEVTVVLAAGEVRAAVEVEVLADVVDEPVETFEVQVVSADGARVADRTALVTITPLEAPQRG